MAKRKILVADDEVWVRELLFELFREEYDVHQAGDGEQAWALLQELPFAVALLDLRMPKLDGLEVLEQLAGAGLATVPLVITANKDVDSAVRAIHSKFFRR
jgi:DNA-binding NtrC family response regulator